MWLGIAVLLRPCDKGGGDRRVTVSEAVNTVYSGNATWEEGGRRAGKVAPGAVTITDNYNYDTLYA